MTSRNKLLSIDDSRSRYAQSQGKRGCKATDPHRRNCTNSFVNGFDSSDEQPARVFLPPPAPLGLIHYRTLWKIITVILFDYRTKCTKARLSLRTWYESTHFVARVTHRDVHPAKTKVQVR